MTVTITLLSVILYMLAMIGINLVAMIIALLIFYKVMGMVARASMRTNARLFRGISNGGPEA